MEDKYKEMLDSLRQVEGFAGFEIFILQRGCKSSDWKTELEGLYRINKPKHPLIKICSQEESDPEAFFSFNNDIGILEVARLKYSFDDNYEKNKITNRICNYLKPLILDLIGRYSNYSIVITVLSWKDVPTEEELIFLKSHIKSQFPLDISGVSLLKRWGMIHICPEEKKLKEYQGYALTVVLKRNGIGVFCLNTDIFQKIKRLLYKKRCQHKIKYGGKFKVYYFRVDSPPTKILSISNDDLECQIKDDEVLILSSDFFAHGKYDNLTRVFGKFKNKIDIS